MGLEVPDTVLARADEASSNAIRARMLLQMLRSGSGTGLTISAAQHCDSYLRDKQTCSRPRVRQARLRAEDARFGGVELLFKIVPLLLGPRDPSAPHQGQAAYEGALRFPPLGLIDDCAVAVC